MSCAAATLIATLAVLSTAQHAATDLRADNGPSQSITAHQLSAINGRAITTKAESRTRPSLRGRGTWSDNRTQSEYSVTKKKDILVASSSGSEYGYKGTAVPEPATYVLLLLGLLILLQNRRPRVRGQK